MTLPRLRRATTHTQTGSIAISATPETLWDLITHVDTICEWYDNWEAVTHDTADGRLQVGTSFRLVRHHRGGDDVARCRVTELSAPTRLTWLQSSTNHPLVTVTFHLMPDITGGTTELVNTRRWTGP